MPSLSRILALLPNLSRYIKDYHKIANQIKWDPDFSFGKFIPVLIEKFETSWVLMHFYFYQDLYAAQKIYLNQAVKHVDIWSRVDWFVAHIASFRQIEMFDIRPLSEQIKNVSFVHWDLLNLESKYHEYADSISSLSVIEHFWLWRYGDQIDAYGHLKGIQAIHSMLKPDGLFYFSVPIGPQRIEFNAHRVFSMIYLLKIFEPLFIVEEFSYVDDQGNFIENAVLIQHQITTNYRCNFGNGIFILRKK